jgi:hypothetical protein
VKRGLDRAESVRPATKAAVERRKASAPDKRMIRDSEAFVARSRAADGLRKTAQTCLRALPDGDI